ncbi:helix-turn-helix domain-containing protein [Mangrovimonas futianensis]|uniref:helix-turn-helix domain-containing protein n=1 Tax=Mangrovimonas futianensis TaxID=2895523 RepID=UPI001E4E8482|nr:helix-turn-helix domain-containing protein [Mangrovimonas futianensis]MCF1422895.1 helix-turn-helix domain-containing protein [Mangrovimonas futianensis]
MNKIYQINSVTEYNHILGIETLHPLISFIDFSQLPVFDYSKVEPNRYTKAQMNMFAIFLKDAKCGNITYGVNNYDYEEGSLIFMAPGQAFGIEGKGEKKGEGFALVFHPDLILGTPLSDQINSYTFFSYEVNEALNLSARERDIINNCFSNIQYELEHAIDSHSKTLIVSYIDLFLNYSKRFYERQFNTRSHVNKDILARFEKIIRDYFQSGAPSEHGLPSVSYCADILCVSPNYLGDLLKKETGKSAQEHIQLKLIEVAKTKMFGSEKSISEIAFELGFKHPQHFTRMFKKNMGISPLEYRNLN